METRMRRLALLPKATFWRIIREEIGPELVDEAESLQTVDEDDLPGVVDKILQLAIRLENLSTGNVVAPLVALEEGLWSEDI